MRSTRNATAARRAQGEESRAKLVEAATALIGERGFAATSVGDICRRAGVAKTALYWHFASKEGLLAAVLEDMSSRWIERIRKRAYLEARPLARLNRMIEDWRRLLKHHPHLVRLPLFVRLELSRAEAPSDALGEALQRMMERGEAALAEGIEDSFGVGRVPDRDVLARTTHSLISAAVQHAATARDEAEIDRIFDELRQTLIVVIGSRLPTDLQPQFAAGSRSEP